MKNVRNFYNKKGWKELYDQTLDAKLFEDFRPVARKYISRCRLRILDHIPKKGGDNILDFASGPIQYKEYLNYSKKFLFRHCVDFSTDAIKMAKKKIGNHGKYYCNDFNKIKFKENFFDCTISLHTIYHINKKLQKKTILKMLKSAKKNSNIIIVYSNPNTLINRFKKILNYKKKKQKIYFYCHENKWWDQFSQLADVKIKPWRSFASQHQKILIPNNKAGSVIFDLLFYFENKFPNFFVKYFQYCLIVLRKK
jgi:ubiquinone/menaquinone biosynthesis C-methylase UbiE